MKNTCLKDFSEDQLRTMLRLVMREQSELRSHVTGLKMYKTIAELNPGLIFEYETEIEQLNEIATQFAGALVSKENERIITSN